MRHGIYYPVSILYVVAGIMLKIDWVINEARFHARMISKASKQSQTRARLSPQVLLFPPRNIYAEGNVHLPETESFVL